MHIFGFPERVQRYRWRRRTAAIEQQKADKFATATGELRLDLDGKLYAEALGPNDDPLLVAGRLLRQKYGRQNEFYGPINYPPRSIR